MLSHVLQELSEQLIPGLAVANILAKMRKEQAISKAIKDIEIYKQSVSQITGETECGGLCGQPNCLPFCDRISMDFVHLDDAASTSSTLIHIVHVPALHEKLGRPTSFIGIIQSRTAKVDKSIVAEQAQIFEF